MSRARDAAKYPARADHPQPKPTLRLAERGLPPRRHDTTMPTSASTRVAMRILGHARIAMTMEVPDGITRAAQAARRQPRRPATQWPCFKELRGVRGSGTR